MTNTNAKWHYATWNATHEQEVKFEYGTAVYATNSFWGTTCEGKDRAGFVGVAQAIHFLRTLFGHFGGGGMQGKEIKVMLLEGKKKK